MKQEEIIEGNRLIAEFYMVKSDWEERFAFVGNPQKWYRVSDLKFHEEWNWLMPVVEKIEDNGHKTVLAISDFSFKYYQNIITGTPLMKTTIDNPSKVMGQSNIKIEAVWIAAVGFIKWHNQRI